MVALRRTTRERLALGLTAFMVMGACSEDSLGAQLCAQVGALCDSPATQLELSFAPSRGVYANIDGGEDRDFVLASRSGIVFDRRGELDNDLLYMERGAVDVRAHDLDGDGIDEVICASDQPALIWALRRESVSTYGDLEVSPEGLPQALWVGALRPGGSPRVVLATTHPGGVEVFDAELEPIDSAAFGDTPSALTAADVDGDGILDLLVADFGDASFHLLRGDAAGGLGSAERFTSALLPEAIDTADIDGDGAVDVLVQGRADARVWLHHGDGAGGFADGVALTLDETADTALGIVGIAATGDTPGWIVGASRRSLIAAEVDATDKVGDRLLGPRRQGLTELRRDGAGLLSHHAGGATLVATEPVLGFVDIWRTSSSVLGGLGAADLDGDGALDLAVLDNAFSRSTLAVFLADGDGGWTSGPSSTLSPDVLDLVLADVSGDGLIDAIVVVADLDDPDAEITIEVAIGDGAGGFTFGEVTPLDRPPAGLTPIANQAGDRSDLALSVADDAGAEGALLLSFDAEGAVAQSIVVPTGGAPTNLAAVDIDLDGLEDLVAVVRDEGGVSLSLVHALGAGGWGAPQTIAVDGELPILAESLLSYTLIVGDVDVDGRVDAVLAGGEASVLVRDLTTLDPAGIQLIEHDAIRPTSGLVVDLDEDGAPDLLLGEPGGASALLAPISGSAELIRGHRGEGPSAAFIDAKGRGRVVVDEGRAVGVRQLGDALSLAQIDHEPSRGLFQRVVSADVDGDNHADLIASGDEDLTVFWGPLTDDSLVGVNARSLAGGPHIVATDLDGDLVVEVVSGGADGRLVVGRAQDRRPTMISEAKLEGAIVGVFAHPLMTLSLDDAGLRRTDWALDLDLVVTGTATFGEPGLAPLNAVAGDLDGDGERELIVFIDGAPGVFVAWGRAASPITELGVDLENAQWGAAGDLDGDGDDELAIVDGIDVQVFDFEGRRAGEPVRLRRFVGSTPMTRLAIADLDGDGRTELVRAQRNSLDLIFGLGPGPDYYHRFLGGEPDIVDIALADVDDDGILEPLVLYEERLTFWRSGGV